MPASVVQPKHPSEQRQKPGYEGLKVKRKSSKPIINWLQRKLGGSVRGRRVSSPTPAITYNGRPTVQAPAARSTHTRHATSLKDLHNVRVQKNGDGFNGAAVDEDGFRASREWGRGPSNDLSLNADELGGADSDEVASTRISSVAAISIWSRSNPFEADEDASIRPLPPTSPPSPSPSRDSSSYLSDPRTFQSITASTKPTTVMSIDLPTMAHIAQAPTTPTSVANPGHPPSPVSRFPPHIRTSSNMSSLGGSASITFSALPSSPQSSRPSSLNPTRPPGLAGSSSVQAPQYTSYHPRNNPRPSSPPLDNASVLTLASSAFLNIARTGAYTFTGGDSVSHFGPSDSVSHIMVDDMLLAEDRDASVRALRPRSSRRGSWESEVSGWSARLAGARERSLTTAPSFRTGGHTTVEDQYNQEEDLSLLDVDTLSRTETEDTEDVLHSAYSTGKGRVGEDVNLPISASPEAKDDSVVIDNEQSIKQDPIVEQKINTPPIVISSDHGDKLVVTDTPFDQHTGTDYTSSIEDQPSDATPKEEKLAILVEES